MSKKIDQDNLQNFNLNDIKIVKNYMLRNCFYTFFNEAFYFLNPGRTFHNNWHIHYLASLLGEVANGKHKNIIICIPPRALKSTMISVAWCAWLLGRNPALRILCASYIQKLSNKLSIDCRNLIKSSWYQEIFPELKLASDQNSKSKFCTINGGFRLSTSIAGSVIGEGGDILICDDPLAPTQANSRLYRDKAYDWFMESFSTRLDNKKQGIKLIVMQRLHDDDLCGRIIREMGDFWKIVVIPAISDQELVFHTENFSKIMHKGELLNEAQEGKEQLDIMEKQLGVSAFSAQYLQKPIPESGNILQKEWLQFYDELPNEQGLIVQSWDLAFTENINSDYSVCTTWQIISDKLYLLDVLRVKKEFVGLMKEFKNNYQKWQANLVIVEDSVASKSFIQNVRATFECNIKTSRPKGDKVTRLAITSPIFEAKRVYLPKSVAWLADYMIELMQFPHVRHDDQVDSTSQFLLHINEIQQYLKFKDVPRIVML